MFTFLVKTQSFQNDKFNNWWTRFTPTEFEIKDSSQHRNITVSRYLYTGTAYFSNHTFIEFNLQICDWNKITHVLVWLIRHVLVKLVLVLVLV